MFVARLFDRSEPDRPLGAHVIDEGITRIGRDPNADWAIADPDCEISRQHLELVCRDGALLLKPLGANGVFRDAGGERFADGVTVPVGPGDAINFGRYRLVVFWPSRRPRRGARQDRGPDGDSQGGCR